MAQILNLKKDYKQKEKLDYLRFNSDQQAIENFVNIILSGIEGASNVGINLVTGITATNVQGALEQLRQMISDVIVGQVPPGSLTSEHIGDNAVDWRKLADSSVKTAKIEDKAITNAKLADDIKIGSLANLQTTSKDSIVNAVNEVSMTLNILNAEYNVYMSGKDANGVFTVVDVKRSDGTLYMHSVLSNMNSQGKYTKDTRTYYAADGTTVTRIVNLTLGYDTAGDLTSKVVS